jgi:hypothetical protein
MSTSCDLTRAVWRKSSHSQGNADTCVEVAQNLTGIIAVRDSTDPGGPALIFAPAAWATFTDRLKAGEPAY